MFAKYTKSKAVSMALAYTLPTENPQWPTVPQPTHLIHEPASSQSTESQPSTPQANDDEINVVNPKPDNEFVDVHEENLYVTNT